MTRNELIWGLTKMSEPSREVDFWCWWYSASTESKKDDPQPSPEDYVRRELAYPQGTPFYTSSVDAAMLLIPAGAFWHIGAGKTREDEPLYGALVQEGRVDGRDLGTGESDGNAAIALCIAALRAASQSPELRTEQPK